MVTRLIFLLLICFFLYFYNLGNYKLFNLDEAIYSSVAKQMLYKGNILNPKYCGKDFYEKPPLLYWLMMGSFKIFGINEFSARFPSALAGIAIICIMFLFCRAFFGNEVGFLSGIILSTNFLMIALARAASTDMVLLLFITLSCLSFIYATLYKKENMYYLFFVSLGLAVLTKGPIGALIPLSTVIVFLLLTNNLRLLKNMKLFKGIGILLLITLPWYVSISLLTKGEFLEDFILYHNIGRFLRPMQMHSGSFLYYPVVILFGFFPWSAFLFNSISKIKKKPVLFFCLIWSAITFLIFSFSRTKLPNYILPILPPLSIIVAEWYNRKNNIPLCSLIVLSGLMLSFTLLFLFYKNIIIPHLPAEYEFLWGESIPAMFYIGLVFFFSFVMIHILLIHKREDIVFWVKPSMMVVLTFILVNHVVPKVWEYKEFITVKFLKKIGGGGDKLNKIFMYRCNLPTISFYSSAEVILASEQNEIEANTKTYLITKSKFKDEIDKNFELIEEVKGYVLYKCSGKH